MTKQDSRFLIQSDHRLRYMRSRNNILQSLTLIMVSSFNVHRYRFARYGVRNSEQRFVEQHLSTNFEGETLKLTLNFGEMLWAIELFRIRLNF